MLNEQLSELETQMNTISAKPVHQHTIGVQASALHPLADLVQSFCTYIRSDFRSTPVCVTCWPCMKTQLLSDAINNRHNISYIRFITSTIYGCCKCTPHNQSFHWYFYCF